MTSTERRKINELIHEIRQDWLHGRDRRVALGEKLIRLKALLPHGHFKSTIKKLKIPYPTANTYMKEARQQGQQKYQSDTFDAVESGLEPNLEFGKATADPQADNVVAAVQATVEDRQGRAASRIARIDVLCEDVTQKNEIKRALKELTAAQIHELLYPHSSWLLLHSLNASLIPRHSFINLIIPEAK